ncbi:MAG: AAA family ATPase [Planctomycetes bacterium]|nr:AAA family ATPase [Planctomycetota bacterium]
MSGLDELARLGEAACYPHAPAAVQVLQTHLSIVCLAGDLVYKLKKAIALPFVDFTTLAARRQACRDEVRLNRRLCSDTYLGTAALRRTANGGVRFAALGDDDGAADLDTAVVMRRLPQERMLDELLAHGAVTAAEIEALARQVAAFHAGSEPVPMATAMATAPALVEFAAANFRELQAMPKPLLPPPLLAAAAAASAPAFAALLPRLLARAASGHVKDGHGDLHARNVCMTEPPTIYDCIEFEPRFRIGDVATEIAFLVMDLRYRGAPALATAFVRAYTSARGDAELPSLLPTLASYRAMVRGKVAAFAAAESEQSSGDRERSARSAVRHLELAAALLLEAGAPLWIVVCGPPACGKSTLVQALAAVASWPAIGTDPVRRELAGLAPTERGRPEHYTAEFSQRTYREVLARAIAATNRGEPVVLLDGNFPTIAHRRELLAPAAAAGCRLVLVHVTVDAETARTRARQRAADPRRTSDADEAVTGALHARFEAPGDEIPWRVDVDGGNPTATLVHLVLQSLLSLPMPSVPGH